jgi:hypothetical protein
VNQQRLPQGQNPLLWSNATSLDHDEVLFDLSVVGEATHGVNGLVSHVVIGGSIVTDQLKVKIKMGLDFIR